MTMFRCTNLGPSKRQLRVGEQVRHALSAILQRGEIIDPVIETTIISIAEVRMSPDFKICTAFVSQIGANDPQTVIAALNKHTKFIRGRVSFVLKQMKYISEFRFRLDTSYDNLAKINDLLRSPEVARDLCGKEDKEV